VRATLLAAGLLTALVGCTDYIAHRIVAPPNGDGTGTSDKSGLADISAFLNAHVYSRVARVPVGPPPAELSVAVLPPGTSSDAGSMVGRMPRGPDFPAYIPAKAPPAGTVLLLAGYRGTKFTMLPWALHFTAAGYRCVLVDLRGEGDSTPTWVSYGNYESADVKQVMDWLYDQHLVAPPLVLFGVSYGASVALRAAGLDRRVAAVIAIEPFVDATDVIKRSARESYPYLPFLRLFMTDGRLDAAIKTAGQIAGTRLEDASVVPAVEQLSIPVLYVHGGGDQLIPEEAEAELVARTRNATYLSIPGATHHQVFVQPQAYADQLMSWLQKVRDSAEPDPE